MIGLMMLAGSPFLVLFSGWLSCCIMFESINWKLATKTNEESFLVWKGLGQLPGEVGGKRYNLRDIRYKRYN